MELPAFNPEQITVINRSTLEAEDLVSNFYKLSSSQWLKKKYDIKTMVDLLPDEIVHGPFAQILHYKGWPRGASLESKSYDFYKICIQDHSILGVIQDFTSIQLFPFSLYIIIHELIHVVRFSQYSQNFYASIEEKMSEEKRVHEKTHEVLKDTRIQGVNAVFDFYHQWLLPLDSMKAS
jgi:hypothetical protein